MARGDTVNSERTFSDRDDEGEELGGFTGGIPYDEDEDEDGGWAINKDHSDSLWDSAEDTDDDDDAETTELVDAGESEEEEADLFGGALSTPRRRGRRPAEKSPAPGSEQTVPVAAALGATVGAVVGAAAKGAHATGKPAAKGALRKARAPLAKAAPKKDKAAKHVVARKAANRAGKTAKPKAAASLAKAKKATKRLAKRKPATSAKKTAKRAKSKK